MAVRGVESQLGQVFLNLVKNAAEACVPPTGDILITTRYQRGVSVAVTTRVFDGQTRAVYGPAHDLAEAGAILL